MNSLLSLGKSTKFVIYGLIALIISAVTYFGYAFFQFKAAEFYISNLSIDLENGFGIKVTVGSSLTSPLSIDIPQAQITVKYNLDDQEYEFAKIKIEDVSVAILDSLNISPTIFIENIDLSKLQGLGKSKDKFVEITLDMHVYMLYFPIPISLKSRRINLPPPPEEPESASFFKSLEEAQNEFYHYFYKDDEERPAKSKNDPEYFELSTEVVEERVPENKILKNLQFQDYPDKFTLKIVLNPIFNSNVIRGLHVFIEKISIVILKPLILEIDIREFKMSNDEYSLYLDIVKVENRNIPLEIAKIVWGEKCLFIQVDKICSTRTQNESNAIKTVHYSSENGQDKRGELAITSETSILDSPEFQFVLGDMKIEPNKLSIDFAFCANKLTALFGSIIHLIIRLSVFNLYVSINNTRLCGVKIRSFSPLKSLNEDGTYFKLLKIEVSFTSKEEAIMIKKENNIELKLAGFKGAAAGLNNVSIILNTGQLPILKIGSTEIKASPIDPSTIQAKEKSSLRYIIQHELIPPEAGELLKLHSSVNNFIPNEPRKKTTILLTPFSYSIIGRRITIKQTLLESLEIGLQPHANKNKNGDLFVNGSIETSICQNEPSELNPINFIHDLIGEDITFSLGGNNEIKIHFKLETDILVPEIKESSEPKEGLNVISSYSTNWFCSTDSIGLLFKSKNKCENSSKLVNCITIPKLKLKQDYGFCSVLGNISATTIELSIIENNLYVDFNKDLSLELTLIETDNQMLRIAKPIQPKIKIEKAEDYSQIISKEEFNLENLVDFIFEFQFSNYKPVQKPKKEITPLKDLSLKCNFSLQDTSEQLQLNTQLIIPSKLISEKIINHLCFLDGFQILFITSEKAKLEFFIGINKEVIEARIVGGISSIDAPAEIMFLGNSPNPFTLQLNLKNLVDKLLNTINFEKDESVDEKPQQSSNHTPEMLHIEPCELSSTKALVTKFSFKIFSENLNRILGESLGNLLKDLDMENYPEFLKLNISLNQLPDFCIKKEKDKLIFFKELKFSLDNNYPILYNKKTPVKDINENYLRKIYNNDQVEVEHFKKTLNSLDTEVFKYPTQISFVIDSTKAKEIEISKDFFSKSGIIISNSITREIVMKIRDKSVEKASKFKGPLQKSTSLPDASKYEKPESVEQASKFNGPLQKSASESNVQKQEEGKEEKKSKTSKIVNFLTGKSAMPDVQKQEEGKEKEEEKPNNTNFKLWLSPNKIGAFILKLNQNINFIHRTFSLSVQSTNLPSVQLRFFGLQKDTLMEEKGTYDNTLYFNLSEITIPCNSKTTPKDCSPIRIVSSLDNSNHIIFQCFIKNDLTNPISIVKTFYFSRVGRFAISKLYDWIKDLFGLDDKTKFPIMVEKESRENLSGIERCEKNKEKSELEQPRISSIPAIA